MPLGRRARIFALFLAGIVLVYLYPLADLLAYAVFTSSTSIMAFLSGWKKLVVYSMLLPALGAMFSVGLALPLAWWLHRTSRRALRKAAWAAVLMLLTMPGPLLGVGLATVICASTSLGLRTGLPVVSLKNLTS